MTDRIEEQPNTQILLKKRITLRISNMTGNILWNNGKVTTIILLIRSWYSIYTGNVSQNVQKLRRVFECADNCNSLRYNLEFITTIYRMIPFKLKRSLFKKRISRSQPSGISHIRTSDESVPNWYQYEIPLSCKYFISWQTILYQYYHLSCCYRYYDMRL